MGLGSCPNFNTFSDSLILVKKNYTNQFVRHETDGREEIIVGKCSGLTIESIVNGGLVANKEKSPSLGVCPLLVISQSTPFVTVCLHDLCRQIMSASHPEI